MSATPAVGNGVLYNHDSYQMFDMIEVEVNCDADILGRVNSGSHFRDVIGKKVREQLPLAHLRCRRRCRCVRCLTGYGSVAYNQW